MKNICFNPHFEKTCDGRPACAIFSDRDGTLIRHVDYISEPKDVCLLPGVKDAVQEILKAKIPFYIITNQSGVGRGYFPIERVHACQRRLFELLGINPDQLAGWCIAPEAPDVENGYRKPSPRFIHEACERLGLSPGKCHMIGDTRVDLETAWNAGAHAWAVACGKAGFDFPAEDQQEDGYELKENFAACIRSIRERV
ncbi:MAG: HAD-IIIA family hydrolase [Opitutales bacterium]